LRVGSCNSQGLKKARRRLYEDVYGPIPAGCALFRCCREKRCVRPEHFQVRELTDPRSFAPSPLLWRGRWEWAVAR